MKTGRLIRIGLLFAGTIIILFWGLNFLKGKNFLQPEKIYFASYEKIGGLMVSSPVTIKGFKVGDVREIKLYENDFSKVLVRFVINYPDLEIPTGSIARIYSTDLMGTKGIEIVLTDSSTIHSYSDTLRGSIEGDLKDQVNTQMLPLKRKAEDLMASMDSVLVSLYLVFGQENRSNLAQSFEIVTQTLKNFEETSVFLDTFVKSESGRLSFIMSNLDSLSGSLITRTEEFKRTIFNLEQFTDTLNKIPLRNAVKKFSLVLEDVSQLITRVNSGEGSLGKLIMDDSLYNSIETVSYSLNKLLEDVRQNPRRYVNVSVIDRGRTIIASDNNALLAALSKDLNLDYFVCLVQTQLPLRLDHTLYDEFKKLKSIQVGKDFYYYILKTGNYDKAKRLVSKYSHTYPNAAIFSWIEGKWQRIVF